VTYGVRPAQWGQGIATRALQLLLQQLSRRPLYARAATDNAGSLRVLTRHAFRPIRTEHSYARGRGDHIDETNLRLDRYAPTSHKDGNGPAEFPRRPICRPLSRLPSPRRGERQRSRGLGTTTGTAGAPSLMGERAKAK
jgi:hypothetical protein